MKQILFVFVFALLNVTLLGQFQSYQYNNTSITTGRYHSFRDISISISPNLLLNTPNGTQFAGGVKLRMYLGKRISFDSDLLFGQNYLHFGPGIIGIPLWYFFLENNFDDDDFGEDNSSTLSDILFNGVIMLLSFEHTAYHIPVRNYIDISPYVSLLRFRILTDYEYSTNHNMEINQACFAVGLEVNKYYNRFLISPYAEYNIGYSDHMSGLYFGIYCGFYIPSKI